LPEQPKIIPRKIWQSWKVDPTRFEDRDVERARTWTTKNPGWRYEVLTDDNADEYVSYHFGPEHFHRPDIIHVYKSLNAKVIKSDLLRYLIMYVEGGLWADIDVEAIRPIKSFIPKRFDEAEIDMVIGIEVDEPAFFDHAVLGSKSRSFCQWTFMAKPRLPVMMLLIENIMKWLHGLSLKQGKPISDLYLDFNEVIAGTGPSAFTKATLQEMSRVVGEPVTWERFHDLEEAKLVGGVLVLTVEAFAAGTGHSDSGNHGGKGAMVKHHFHASSWPTMHPRYKHAIYGEVEKCNWDVECVKLWDANTAFFDALPESERLKIIDLKTAEEQPESGDKKDAQSEGKSEAAVTPDAAPEVVNDKDDKTLPVLPPIPESLEAKAQAEAALAADAPALVDPPPDSAAKEIMEGGVLEGLTPGLRL